LISRDRKYFCLLLFIVAVVFSDLPQELLTFLTLSGSEEDEHQISTLLVVPWANLTIAVSRRQAEVGDELPCS
jgi:hypothetical protein